MADAFDAVFGQPQVRDFLRAAVSGDKVSHAYLLVGPAGSNKTAVAFALAQSVLCEHGTGCGECDECRRVMARTHPDVHFYAPEGAMGYLVEQVRSIVADVSLAPIRAKRKVYILDRVDLLGVQAANAFLKTLEEPPTGVLIILLGRTQESVLSTIVSRCQVIPFRTIPAAEAAGLVSQNTGATRERAAWALQACDGSVSKAVAFLKSGECMELRRNVLGTLAALRLSDDWDIVQAASSMVVQAKAPLDEVRSQQARDLEDASEFLERAAVRQIEQRNKRLITAKSNELLHQTTAIIRGWLRDVLAMCAGAPEVVVNSDALDAIADAAANTDAARVAAALEAVRRYDEAISYNVSPETCIDAMLLDMRHTLYDASGSHAGRD
ncbi:DNA polymerase III subunit [Adlercreutzia sp. ZJ141]|uniref:DNA polymerase III subunit n=1 Tax=Adlercreutzia sp. ZJ141 TaxID=2709406 RepID=UPI0013EE393F|nr:DNA polymerase III subunit delta' [Adlercreutzia sp. ZJ141]